MQFEFNYRRRITAALAVALVLHTAALAAGWSMLPDEWGRGPAPTAAPAPLVLRLAPSTRPPAKQLVAAITPSETVPSATQFIAESATQASGPELQSGEQPGPPVEEESESVSLASPAFAPPLPSDPAPAPSPVPPPNPVPPPTEEEPPAPAPPEEEALPKENDAPVQMKERTAPTAAPPDAGEPFDVAQAAPPSASPALQPPSPSALPADAAAPAKPSRGRLDNAVMNRGLASYEALQDDIAPYLAEVKRRVEQQWNEALVLRYSGTTPQDVRVECEIGADGRLVSVRISQPAEDGLFGALCVRAIRDAGPFAPFPFAVPEIYRNQNLEIRWHFNFL